MLLRGDRFSAYYHGREPFVSSFLGASLAASRVSKLTASTVSREHSK